MNPQQKGMALVEACLVGLVLGLMILAGRWLMQQQHRLQHMQQSTHLALFSHDAQGKPVPVFADPGQHQEPSRFLATAASANESLLQELLKMNSGVWTAQSRVFIPWPSWLLALPAGTSLRRQSQLWAGAGQAVSTQQTRQRLERSATAWNEAAKLSRFAAEDTVRLASPLDRPWGRPKPDLDWLGAWQDFVPDQQQQGGV